MSEEQLGNQQPQTVAPAIPPAMPPTNTAPTGTEIDYGKLESIIDKKLQVTENGVMKSFFKEQGLSEEEAKKAIETFKATKLAEQNNTSVELTQAQQQLQEAQEQLKEAAVQTEAFKLSTELGLDAKTLPYVTKLADFSGVYDDKGVVKSDLVKVAIEKVLTDIPAFKAQPQGSAGGFKIGGEGGQGNTPAQEELLAKAFGNK